VENFPHPTPPQLLAGVVFFMAAMARAFFPSGVAQ